MVFSVQLGFHSINNFKTIIQQYIAIKSWQGLAQQAVTGMVLLLGLKDFLKCLQWFFRCFCKHDAVTYDQWDTSFFEC